MVPLLILAVIPLAALAILVGMYNGLVGIRNHCKESWADVDTELKRRHNLIPNLVNTVKGYAEHEQGLLEELTELRERCVNTTGSPQRKSEIEEQFQSKLHGLMVRLEAYPDLKASGNFLSLQEELANTENRIQAARRFFNGNVRDNNNRVQMFPSSVIAAMFRFKEWEYFKLEQASEAAAPRMDFD